MGNINQTLSISLLPTLGISLLNSDLVNFQLNLFNSTFSLAQVKDTGHGHLFDKLRAVNIFFCELKRSQAKSKKEQRNRVQSKTPEKKAQVSIFVKAKEDKNLPPNFLCESPPFVEITTVNTNPVDTHTLF